MKIHLKTAKLLSSLIVGLFLLMPTTTFAAAVQCDPKPGSGALPQSIFVPWYKYLNGERTVDGKCVPKMPNKKGTTETDYVRGITLIALAVLDLAVRVSGLVAAGFMIWGAIQYIISQGEPNSMANAKSTLTNAIVGLVIIFISIYVVQFIGRTVQ